LVDFFIFFYSINVRLVKKEKHMTV
jgi:hypothetical protein